MERLMNSDDKFWRNVLIAATILSLSIFVAQKAFPEEFNILPNGNIEVTPESFNKIGRDLRAYDILLKVDKEQKKLINNMRKQLEMLEIVNKNNDTLINNNERIVDIQEKHIDQQHKDINRLIDEKSKMRDGGIVDKVKKEAAFPLASVLLLLLLL
tara:strand:- start:1404 stop:1871 length:468 start_codon:yes stop_codon:yes gene_type:complete